MKRYEPTIEWGETESLGRVTATVRLQESVLGSVAKVEEVVDELNAARCEAAQAQVDLLEARRDRDLLRDERDLIARQRDALRKERDESDGCLKDEYRQNEALRAELTRVEDNARRMRTAIDERDNLKTERDAMVGMSEEFTKAKEELLMERLTLIEQRDDIRAELYVLRDALRTVAGFYQAGVPIGALPIGRCLAALTPEQRAACGWPDPETPKEMTWSEAVAAMRASKSVSWYHWVGVSVSLCHDGVVRFDGPVYSRRTFEFRLEYAEDAYWRVVEPGEFDGHRSAQQTPDARKGTQ